MLITDQVATAPCTDCAQAQRPTFEAKPSDEEREGGWAPSLFRNRVWVTLSSQRRACEALKWQAQLPQLGAFPPPYS